MGLTARARWSFARRCAAASCDPQLLAFLATLPPCTVALEACGSAHDWGREIAKLGHMVRLIAPAYVKPFVKRQKNDNTSRPALDTHPEGRHAYRVGTTCAMIRITCVAGHRPPRAMGMPRLQGKASSRLWVEDAVNAHPRNAERLSD